MNAIGIIPVRLESTRLPQKAILDICGLPMFVHTYKRAKLTKTLDQIYLATDSKIIENIAKRHNIKTIMTSKKHKNSSERIAEACKNLNYDIIVNIQGDEPLLQPAHVDKIVEPILKDSSIKVSIGITKFKKKASPSDLKAVIDLDHNLLYSSRNDIPFNYKSDFNFFWKLVFIVPHRKKYIMKYLEWEPSPLEIIEDNHFLRILENGIKIKCIEVESAEISVDTKEDLEEVRLLMAKDNIIKQYT